MLVIRRREGEEIIINETTRIRIRTDYLCILPYII